jgi:peptidoglycan/xylan/chitin deacetylase (PgdA/CDA1 family)
MVIKQQLAGAYKSAIGNLEYTTRKWNYPATELIVLCMHSTPKDRMDDFKRLTKWLLQHFKPLRPSEMDLFFDNRINNGPYILFTFDDGLRNNLHVAKYLSEEGVGAYFFLVPDFIQAVDQQAYYRKNIRQVIDTSFDKLEEDFTSISFQEAKELRELGHEIGSHTQSHLLRAGMSIEDATREIQGSLQTLRSNISPEINSFCSPIDTLISVDSNGKKLIQENYKYHFTTFPGRNAEGMNSQIIFRRNIEVNWSRGKIKFALGAWDLPRWAPGIERFRAL